MATDSLALLFRLRGDSSSLRAATGEARQAVRQLQQSLGPQLGQALSVTNRGFAEATNTLAVFAGQRLPLVGSAVVSVTQSLQDLALQTATTGSSVAAIAGPVAIATAALAAQVAVVVSLTKVTFDLAKASADYQGKLFDLSQQIGVSVETLSALEVAALQTGGSLEGLVQSLGIFQRRLEESVEDQGSKAAVTFRRLGVEATDTEAAFRQTLAALARMPEGFRQTATALELFGRSGKAILAVAKESNGDIDQLIERLRGLGLVTTEQAELADRFNDEIVLLQVQLRGLGTQAIPVVLEALRDLSELLKENRALFNFLGGVVKANAIIIRTALGLVTQRLEEMQTVLSLTAAMFRQIKESVEFIVGHPIPIPQLPGSSTPPPAETQPAGTTPQRDPFTEQLEDEIAARKRLQAVLNVALADRQRQAEASIALAQREFEAGRRTREQLLQATISGTQRQAQADIERLENDRSIKLKEQALAKDDLQKKQQLADQILAIDTQIADKRSALRQSEADLRARFELEERRADLAHEQRRLEALTQAGQDRIAEIERLLAEERVEREAALTEIEAIEDAALRARGQLLKRELELAGVGPERQVVLDKIKAIETERTALERQQSDRRKQLTREEFESKRQILLGGLDALLQVEQVQGEARIAVIQALAAARVKTEEQAAQEILAIRLRSIDAEIEAAKIRQQAAAGITDPKERRDAQAQLEAELRVLNARRVALQDEGNREIDDARSRDLANERDYFNELRKIREQVINLQREAAEEAIRLMIISGARRQDIIRAQRDLELQEEKDRHARALGSIRAQQREVDSEIRLLELRLDAMRIGTTEEIEEHNRLIESLERLRAKRAELNALEDAEGGLSAAITKAINTGAEREEKEADPFGRLRVSLADIKDFANQIESSIVPLNQLLTSSFFQVAEAIGSVVQQWVLLGETGPAVMRKILAQALASLAKEASINAIKELALGFAMLFINPAAAGAHFTSAALWGSIAGGAALAGRGVAGDLFKQPSGNTGSQSSASTAEALNTIIQGRNQTQRVEVILRSDMGELDRVISASVVRNIGEGGEIREVIGSDGR